MARLSVCMMIVALWAGGNLCHAAAPNLLANPGFEAGTDSPTGWGLGMEGKGAGSAIWSEERAHSGGRCVRVELATPGDYYMAAQVTPPATADPAKLYRICGWYRANADDVAHPTVYSEDAGGKFLGAFEFNLPRADGWTFFDTVFAPKPGADHFRVQLRVTATPGVVYYDDVTLAEAAAFSHDFDTLADRLKPDADKLAGYWRVVTPAEGGLELRLRGTGKLHVAMEVVGTAGVGRDAFAGFEVTGDRPTRLPILGPGVAFGKIVTEAVSFSGLKTVRLVAHDLGPNCALLVAVAADPEVKTALIEGETARLYKSPAGEPLPWAPRFVGDDGAAIKALSDATLPTHLRALLGAPTGKAAAVATDGLIKRRPDQWVDDILSGAVKGGAPVKLMCAGNEAESFQCLYVPAANSPGKITAAMSKLAADGGATLPADACKVSMVEYVPFQGKWWPDPLMDIQPFDPQPATSVGPPVLWVTIRVPEGQKAGVYRGKLVVRSEKGGEASAAVEVRVPAFSISRETHLNSSFWLFRGQIRQYFGADPTADAYGKYIDLATSHRLSPIDVWEGPCQPLVKVFREADGTLSYDWSAWDVFIRRVMAGGGNTIHLGWTHNLISPYFPLTGIDRATGQPLKLSEPTGSDEHLRYVGQYLKAAEEHVRSLGFKGLTYVQPYDEPPAENQGIVTRAFDAIGKYAPGVLRLMDACPPDLKGMDLWCPLSPGLPGGYEKAKAGGKTIWWYVCCGPGRPFANFFTNQSVLENRMLFPQSWQFHSTGVLYWGLNYWISWGEKPPDPKFPEGQWKSSTTYDAQGLIGDGYSIYPGPTIDHPLSSIRLETMRDGIEDYEYLYRLAELNQGKRHAKEVEDLLAVPPAISRSLTEYTADPEAYRRYRERLAYWIEALSR